MAEKNQDADSRKRQVARVVSIAEIAGGKYVRAEGEWSPNYILTSSAEKVSRANVVGVVVSYSEEKAGGAQEAVIDDGTGRVPLRAFEGKAISGLGVGEIINVIGRPREFSGGVFLVPEIIRAVKDPKWVLCRKALLVVKNKGLPAPEKTQKEGVAAEKEIVDAGAEVKEVEGNSKDALIKGKVSKQDILNFMRNNDAGAGIAFSKIVELFDAPSIEKMVEAMQKEGDIFMIRPGYFKVLE